VEDRWIELGPWNLSAKIIFISYMPRRAMNEENTEINSSSSAFMD
jgi:hypothetical protein